MEITFPGGSAVEARFDGFILRTDQPEPDGDNTAPSPFKTFLAGLGTCAGYFAMQFCRQRGLDPAGLRLNLEVERGSGPKKLDRVVLNVTPPPGFPEKYRSALVRAIDQCSVKKVILDPPAFETIVHPGD